MLIHAAIMFQWFFCSLPTELVCVISGGYGKFCTCEVGTFLVPNESYDNITGETARNNCPNWSSAQGEVCLHIDKLIICFSYFSSSCSGHVMLYIECPVIKMALT